MRWLFFPEITTKKVVETVYETDTTYQHYKEKYRMDSIKSIALHDSIGYYKKKYSQKLKEGNVIIIEEPKKNEPFSAPLRRFTGQRPFLYGNTFFSTVVAGELLEIDITNDFKIPTITNTITTKETITRTVYSKGLYLGGGVNSLLDPKIGAAYVNNKWVVNYDYSFKDQGIHDITIKRKIF